MEIPTKSQNTEVILRKNEIKFEGKTTAKDMRGWLKGRTSKYGREKNIEYRMLFEGILNAYNHFHPEINLEVEVDAWKGKSSFNIIDKIDSILVLKYQKPEKGEKAKEVQTEISKKEMQQLIETILYLNKGEPIKTPALALTFSDRAELGHSGWRRGDNPFFSDRKIHNKFTLMMNVLDKLQMVKYIGGKTTVLNYKVDFQQSLENFLDRDF